MRPVVVGGKYLIVTTISINKCPNEVKNHDTLEEMTYLTEKSSTDEFIMTSYENGPVSRAIGFRLMPAIAAKSYILPVLESCHL